MRELRVNLLLGFAFADHFFAIAPQEIVDGFDPNPYGASGLVFVEILELEVWRAGLLDDALNDAVNGRIVAALEARHFQRDKVGVSRIEFRGPDFVVSAA